MTNVDKYNALISIQKQLLEFAASQPNYHYKLHGSKEINQALQLGKRLIALAEIDLVTEQSEQLDLYIDFVDNSLSLHNLT